MADPGWYKDRTDRSLARWFDGAVWTDHTLVIADQPDGIMPPPPDEWTRSSEQAPEAQPEPDVPEPESEPERERAPAPASWVPPTREPGPDPQPEPNPEADPWAPPGAPVTGSPLVVDAPPAIEASNDEEAPPVPTLSLGGGAPSSAVAEPGEPQPIVPTPDPAPVVPEPEPQPIIPKPDPAPILPEPEPTPILPEPEPTPEPPPVLPEPAPSPVVPEPEPEPGPASHLEELPPQGTELRVPASASARSEPVPSFVGGRTFEPPSFEGPPPNRLAALPPWARVAVPVLVLVVLLVAAVLVLGGNGGDDGPVSADEAVSIAEADLTSDIPAAKVESLIEQLCGAADTGTSVPAVILAKQLPVDDRAELRSAIDAIGAGAERRCPDAQVDWSGLLDDVYDGAAVAFDS